MTQIDHAASMHTARTSNCRRIAWTQTMKAHSNQAIFAPSLEDWPGDRVMTTAADSTKQDICSNCHRSILSLFVLNIETTHSD
jgi:hypothetical protein